MYRHAGITDGSRVLDVGTGSGYGAALLARRLGDGLVTSIDVDDYLVKAAVDRLDAAGLRPEVITGDATGPLPGSYDRIVSMMSVAPVHGELASRSASRRAARHHDSRDRAARHRRQDPRRRRGRPHRVVPRRVHGRPQRPRLPSGAARPAPRRARRAGRAGQRRPLPGGQRRERVGADVHARRHRPRHPAPLPAEPGRDADRLAPRPRRVMGARHRDRRRPAGRLAVRPPPPVGPRRRHPPHLAHRRETARLRGSRHHQPRTVASA